MIEYIIERDAMIAHERIEQEREMERKRKR